MQSNQVIGVLFIAFLALTIALCVGAYYASKAILKRRIRRHQDMVQASTSGMQGTTSEISTSRSSEKWSRKSESLGFIRSPVRAVAPRHGRNHRAQNASSAGTNRLPSIAEEWLNGGYQPVPFLVSPPSSSFHGTEEPRPQLERGSPASHGCNQTCHGRSLGPGEPQIGLGIAQEEFLA